MWKNKKILVYGLGKSGISAVELLKRHGFKPLVFDDDETKRGLFDCEWGDIREADIIVLSPGISISSEKLLEARLSCKVISEIELGYLFCNAEIIAVTGTNGKTTTTMLIDKLLKSQELESFALGNIGNPFCEIADKLCVEDTAVLEVSSFQLEGVSKFSPNIGILLNITEDHLERHKSMEEYAFQKSKLFLGQTENDFAIFNYDDLFARELSNSFKAKLLPFSMKEKVDGVYFENNAVYCCGVKLFETQELNFFGEEIENLLALTAVAVVKGIHPYAVFLVAKDFQKPQFRLEYIGNIKGKTIINDSKSTNVGALECACNQMRSNTVLLMGGSDKGENFDGFFEAINKKITAVYIVGENADRVLQSAKKSGFENICCCDNLENAIETGLNSSCETILFSPGAKSFDRYLNFEARGEFFNKLMATYAD